MTRARSHEEGGASAPPSRSEIDYPGIALESSGGFRATVTRVFGTFEEAREWRESVAGRPGAACRVCGRPLTGRRRVLCSDECRTEEKKAHGTKPAVVQVEKNIVSDGRGFLVSVGVAGTNHSRKFRALDDAREYRDGLIAHRERLLNKVCPICGAAFKARRADATYCSYKCNVAALKEGRLVYPARAKPATRRRARQMKEQRNLARQMEIRSGPNTLAEVFAALGDGTSEYAKKLKEEAE